MHDGAQAQVLRPLALIRIEPINFVHLAYNDKLITVTTYGSVVVEAITLLCISAYHVRRFHYDTRYGVVNTTTATGHFRAWNVHNTFLGVIHHAHTFRYTL